MALTWHASSHNPGYWLAPSREEGSLTMSPSLLSWPLTRRSLIALGAGAVSAMTGWPRRVLAAPSVTLATPTLATAEHCQATVSVQVMLGGLALGAPYAICGELWEADEPYGKPDYRGELDPLVISAAAESQSLVLTRRTLVVNDGLVDGLGPASDATASPGRVELFVRVWLRNLERGSQYGPWESPRRVALTSPAVDWTRAPSFPGSELMVPRGNQVVPTCA